jgi:hypothetical protein
MVAGACWNCGQGGRRAALWARWRCGGGTRRAGVVWRLGLRRGEVAGLLLGWMTYVIVEAVQVFSQKNRSGAGRLNFCAGQCKIA